MFAKIFAATLLALGLAVPMGAWAFSRPAASEEPGIGARPACCQAVNQCCRGNRACCR